MPPPAFTDDDLARMFTYHAPRPDQVPRYEALRAAGLEMALSVRRHTPPSAEQTLAVRAIQQAVMLANAAIAIHEVEVHGAEDGLDQPVAAVRPSHVLSYGQRQEGGFGVKWVAYCGCGWEKGSHSTRGEAETSGAAHVRSFTPMPEPA